MLPKCIWLNLSVLFAKDVVGTGRTMKALLSRLEKYKPNMIKVARWVGQSHHHCFCLFKHVQEGCWHRVLFSKSAVYPKPATFCSGVLRFDHIEQIAYLTACLRERKGKRTCFAVAQSLLAVPLTVSRSSWLGRGASAPHSTPLYPESLRWCRSSSSMS